MREHAETFHANKGCKLAIVVFIPTSPLQNEISGTFFKGYLHEDEALYTPIFCMKMNHFNIAFHMT